MSSLAIQSIPFIKENSNSKPSQPVLNPYVEYDPSKELKSHQLWSTLHHIAAWTSVVAFTAIAALAIAFASVYYVEHLPIIAIVFFAIGLPQSLSVLRYFSDKSDLYHKEAQIDKKLIVHLNQIRDPASQIRSLGIRPGMDPQKLKNVLAQYHYYKECQKECIDKSKKILSENELELKIGNKVHKVNPKDFNSIEKAYNSPSKENKEIFAAIMDRWQEKNELLHEAASSNLKAAYFLKVMENPHENRQPSDFKGYVNASYAERLLAKDNGDKKADILFMTPRKQYSINDLLSMDTRRIAREILV